MENVHNESAFHWKLFSLLEIIGIDCKYMELLNYLKNA